MAAGDFSASNLVDVQIKADKIWMDNMAKTDYIANVEAFKAIKENQSANVTVLETGKDLKATISWIQDCDIEVTTCTDDCTIDGPELSTESKDLEIRQCVKTSFKVEAKGFRTNLYDMEEVVAKGMLKSSKVLDEEITKRGIAFLNSSAGVNVYAGPLGTLSSGDTQIAAVNWSTQLLPYLRMVATKNRFNNPFMLSGENYYFTDNEAVYNKENSDGKGDYVRNSLLKRYYDLFNIEAVNDPDMVTYLINRGAIAFASKNYDPANPYSIMNPGQQRYSIESRNLPGVRYDVIYTTKCISNKIYHVWDFRGYIEFFLNPTGCVADRTGVLRFLKV